MQEKVEKIIQNNIGIFSRDFRSGENSRKLLLESGCFKDIVEIRHVHYQRVHSNNYVNAWRAANHLRTEAQNKGEGVFDKIISEIEALLKGKEYIDVPYLTNSWTARKNKG